MLKLNVVVGVSGGPDSMYLLKKLIDSPKYVPVVAHVNYGFRNEAINDQKLVETFCKENRIKYYIEKVNKKTLAKYSYLHNKQSIARQIRYDLFFKVGKLENTNVIMTGHHKDDFIETALMQEEKSKELLFYGIHKDNFINGFKVHRSLINMWKSEILEECEKLNIPYNIDQSNLEVVYRRNQIRSELNDYTIAEKEKLFKKFEAINNASLETREKVDQLYVELFKSDLDWNTFNDIDENLKPLVVYKMLINNETRINISSDKLNAIVDFLKMKKGNKGYRLMENLFLTVKKSKIIIYNDLQK